MKITLLAAFAAIVLGLTGTSELLAAPANGAAISGASNYSAPISKAHWCRVHRWCEHGRCWVHRHCW
ncbi:MAG: hypothetical protein AB1508_04390 [Pseudomonadota bacterium]